MQVPEEHIVRLTNEQATRKEILARFHSHFIENPSVLKGDAMVFYFAGHGDQRELEIETFTSHASTDKAQTYFVETICPWDEGMQDETIPGSQVFGIPDRTISALMQRLAHTKDDNIVCMFMLPCVDSGSIHSNGFLAHDIRFLSFRWHGPCDRPCVTPTWNFHECSESHHPICT